MKTFKLIDFWGQAALIGASLLLIIFDLETAYYGYFFVGAWQLLSCLTHGFFTDKYYAVNDRKYYLRTLIWIFIIGILTIPVWMLYGFSLLLVSPFLAIWYASICYAENKLLEHKSLVHLK